MRKIFQKHLLKEKNQYSNNFERIRPITTNRNLNDETPIKLINKKYFNSNFDKHNSKNSTNYSFFNRNNKSFNKHHLLNQKLKNLSEGDLNIKPDQKIILMLVME